MYAHISATFNYLMLFKIAKCVYTPLPLQVFFPLLEATLPCLLSLFKSCSYFYVIQQCPESFEHLVRLVVVIDLCFYLIMFLQYQDFHFSCHQNHLCFSLWLECKVSRLRKSFFP